MVARKMRKKHADFVADLRRPTIHCVFGIFLEEALKDPQVYGLYNEMIHRRLLA